LGGFLPAADDPKASIAARGDQSIRTGRVLDPVPDGPLSSVPKPPPLPWSMASMQTPQLILVGTYFALIFGIGIYATRFVRDSNDYLLAGRRLGIPLAAAALAATHFGGGFVVGTGDWGFRYGLTGMAYAFGTGASLLLLALVSARRMRQLGLVTVPDYLELRYGSRTVSVLGATLSLVAIVGILGAQVWASQGALSILGLDPTLAAVVATVLFIVYTAASGLWGVTLTDALQLLIIFIGVPIAAVLGVREAGGFAGIRENLAGLEMEVTTQGYFDPLGAGGFLVLAAVVPTLMYTLIGQDFYQRLFAARDARVAVRASLVAGPPAGSSAIPSPAPRPSPCSWPRCCHSGWAPSWWGRSWAPSCPPPTPF
jgi:solute:Na+ symporter, SSS family